MAEITKLSQITTLPGVKRDGTNLDGDNFVDAQWVRFVRKEGRPKKMGGYQEVNTPVPGIPRAVQMWSRGELNAVFMGTSKGIYQSNMDANGGAGSTYDRTPVGMAELEGCWTLDTMYDDAAGSKNTIVVAHRNNALTNIDEGTATQVYYGIANQTAAFVPITGLTVSGGVVCVAPYLVYYGSDGLVGWTDANQPQTLASGDAGFDRVTGAKVVKGLPLRSGSGPACILWSLDSVIRMDWIGGNDVFRFSTLSAQSSILSQNCVIEHDGDYFWVGIDRFMVYSGGRVQELPNEMSKNWFFDNLNFSQRQKVWATKVPRFSEIVWFFPFGDSEECNKAIVFNTSLKVWYDYEVSRSAGYYSQVFSKPVMTGDTSQFLVKVKISAVTGSFVAGDVVYGSTSNVPATVYQVISSTEVILKPNTSSRIDLVHIGEHLVNSSRAGDGYIDSALPMYTPYVHEKGLNAVTLFNESAILAYFETSDFGYPTGGAQQNNIEGLNRWTRLVRVEPDFVQSGEMQMYVISREFAQQLDSVSEPFTFGSKTGKIDLRSQGRQIRLKFASNTYDGDFEMGRVILHTEPGDVRS